MVIQSKNKIEYGDFQTPLNLAQKIAEFIGSIFPNPDLVVEPNCGTGNFLKASLEQWQYRPDYFGLDINQNYIKNLHQTLATKNNNINLEYNDFFKKNWGDLFENYQNKKILVVGNPPWVNNSTLGKLKSNNLPHKTNFLKLNGLAAKTGKANFDISEWILIHLINNLKNFNACLAMLCKTTTGRKILKYCWDHSPHISNSSLHLINGKFYFNISADICLLVTHINSTQSSPTATIYEDLSWSNKLQTFGLINSQLIANINNYQKYSDFDGKNSYKWRSGVKHDAVKVMELSYQNQQLINGFGERVEIESNCLYPLLKSSDLGNRRLHPRKFVILTQKYIGEETIYLQERYPQTWNYLQSHRHILDHRKSSVYKNRPQFSIFGIGDYSFAPWKVAISGFYKTLNFSVIGQLQQKPILVDDTCYFLPCYSEEEAKIICKNLNSKASQDFLHSIIFLDAKRPITIDILKRIDIKKISQFNSR